MSYEFDVTVIGGGPGGYAAAVLAGRAGKKTCLVENGQLGGTCLNVGCIPTKVMVKTAELLEQFRRAPSFSIGGSGDAFVDMDALQKRKKAVTGQLVGGVRALLKGAGVTVINGKAEFADPHTVRVDGGKTVTSEYFIVATGSETVIPRSVVYDEGCHMMTSTELLDIRTVPQSLAVLGGGVIGIEFAYVFSQFGCKVTVLEMAEEILPMVDAEVAAMARRRLEKDGVDFCLGAKVTRIRKDAVVYERNGETHELPARSVLMSLGRRPRVQELGAENIGLTLERGAIACDEHLVSSLPNIYVVGDANGKAMLAHTAFKEAEIAVANICGGGETMRYDRIPSCIYMSPEIASVGLTEAQAREQYGDGIRVGRFPLYANGKSLVEGDTDGLIKVIVEPELGEILGVHLYGVHKTEMIALAASAMEAEASAEELVHTVFPHPTVSESLGEAFHAAWNGSAIHNVS